VGQQAMTSNSGRMLFIPASTFDGTPVETKSVDLVAVKLDGSVTQAEFKSRLLEATNGRVSVETFEEEEEDLRQTFTVIVAGVAIAMAVIAIANILATSAATVRERTREFALLKAIGLTPGQIVFSVIVSATTISIIALGAGLVLGFLLNSWIFSVLGRLIGTGPSFLATPSSLWIGLLIPAVLLTGLIGAIWPALQASRTRVVDAIRAE